MSFGGPLMASEWIKVCKETPQKREISLLAKYLACSRGDAFLAWFKVYSWADGETADGFLPGMDLADVAAAAGVDPQVCRMLAAEDIAWLVPMEATATRSAGVRFRHWQTHNGKCAKARALTARRVVKTRVKRGA
jgi:hypothetical protein